MESPKALERKQATNCESPVGTGPFRVTGWKHGDRVTLTKNTDYWGATKPRLSGITWRFLPDSTSRYAALQSGQVDVIDNAQPDQLKAASAKGAIRDLDAPRPGASNRLELNSGHGVFRDESVRQAFIAGAEIDPGLQSLFLGTAKRSYSVLSSAEPLGVLREEPVRLLPHQGEAAPRRRRVEGRVGRHPREGRQAAHRDVPGLDEPVGAGRAQPVPADPGVREGRRVQGRRSTNSTCPAGTPPSPRTSTTSSAPRTRRSAPTCCASCTTARASNPAPSGYFANLAQLDDPALDDAARSGPPAPRTPTSAPTCTSRPRRRSWRATRCSPCTTSRTTSWCARPCTASRPPPVSTPWFGTAWIDR